MSTDRFGNTVTGSSVAVSAIDSCTDELLGHGPNVAAVIAAADFEPGCALLQASAAAIHMAAETIAGREAAKPYIAHMLREAPRITDREQMTVAAVHAWSIGEPRIALAIYRELVGRYPADIVAAAWGQYHALNLGDAVTLRALAEDIMPAHRATAHALAMLAFGEDQCHRPNQGWEIAHRALALDPEDPWVHHAFAHIYESQDRPAEAVRFLAAHGPSWTSRSPFVRQHNYWHLALAHLDLDAPVKALRIHDKQFGSEAPRTALEQVGAIGSLWRLELAGVDVGARWEIVGNKAAERAPEHLLPLYDLHLLYALARAHRTQETEVFLKSLARKAHVASDSVWAMVALPAAQGVVAHARGDHLKASLVLLPLLSQLHRLGGSHTQRDALLQTWIVSALAASEFTAVEDVLMRRVRHRSQLGSIQRFVRGLRKRTPRRLLAA